MSTAAGQSSDRASIFVMGTMMGVAVAGAGALALSYYTRMERERFAADARERYARGSRRHSSEGIKDPSGTSAQRERMGRYRRSAGMIASAQVANLARQTSVDTLDSDIDQSYENNAEYIMATEADDLMRASIGSLDGDFMNGGDGSPSKADGGGGTGSGARSGSRRVVLNLETDGESTDVNRDISPHETGIGRHRKNHRRRHSEDPNAKGSHTHDGSLSRQTPSQRNTRGAQGAQWVPRSPSTAAVKDGMIGTKMNEGPLGAESEYTEFTEDESGNDGDHLMTTLTVVDTPRGAQGGSRAEEFDFDDGGVRGLSASRLSRQDLVSTVNELDDAETVSENVPTERERAQVQPRRSFSRALSFSNVEEGDEGLIGGGADGLSKVESKIEQAAADAIDDDATAADADVAHGLTGDSPVTGATPARGETPSWGIASKTQAGTVTTPGSVEVDSKNVGAAAVPADARGGVRASLSDKFHGDEEVGVNVSKPPPVNATSPKQSFDGGASKIPPKKQNSIRTSTPQNVSHSARGASYLGRGAGHTETSADYTYGRVLAPEDELSSECEEVCLMLRHCTALRERYLFVSDLERHPEHARVDPDHSPHYPHIGGMAPANRPSNPSSPRAPLRELSFNDSVKENGGNDDAGDDSNSGDGVDRRPRGSAVVTGKVDIVPDDELPGPSDHTFEMVAGVVHVYEKRSSVGSGKASPVAGKVNSPSKAPSPRADSSETSDVSADEGSPYEGDAFENSLLFAPPATATEFFHDMHAILRVHSYGPSKSFCHKRLVSFFLFPYGQSD